MAKANAKTDPYAKRSGENDLQWRSRIARQEQAERDRSEPIVPQAALAHGEYADEFVLHAETNTKVQTKLNRGGSPVMRWAREKRLSDTQLMAISHCLRLWGLVGTERRITSLYGERIAASDYESERITESKLEAEADLRRIAGFMRGDHWINGYVPRAYWDVFQNVCRFDEPAGVAGSRLGSGGRMGQERAHTIVSIVADIIAMREGLVPVSRILVA